jgi:hypothetical protein
LLLHEVLLINPDISPQMNETYCASVMFWFWAWPVLTRRAASSAAFCSVDWAKKTTPVSIMPNKNSASTGAMSANSMAADPERDRQHTR